MTRYDIIVVGAGPAGIAAATAAARSGSRVLLLDENPSPGGQIWRSGRPMSLTQPSEGESARRHAVEQLKASGASLLCGYSVYDAPAAGELRAICESPTGSEESPSSQQPMLVSLGYSKLILAT
jgi:2-polyprenyl-6-methoxyphenol hydroxylase-like FAD-dependent oxidoreductase